MNDNSKFFFNAQGNEDIKHIIHLNQHPFVVLGKSGVLYSIVEKSKENVHTCPDCAAEQGYVVDPDEPEHYVEPEEEPEEEQYNSYNDPYYGQPTVNYIDLPITHEWINVDKHNATLVLTNTSDNDINIKYTEPLNSQTVEQTIYANSSVENTFNYPETGIYPVTSTIYVHSDDELEDNTMYSGYNAGSITLWPLWDEEFYELIGADTINVQFSGNKCILTGGNIGKPELSGISIYVQGSYKWRVDDSKPCAYYCDGLTGIGTYDSAENITPTGFYRMLDPNGKCIKTSYAQ